MKVRLFSAYFLLDTYFNYSGRGFNDGYQPSLLLAKNSSLYRKLLMTFIKWLVISLYLSDDTFFTMK